MNLHKMMVYNQLNDDTSEHWALFAENEQPLTHKLLYTTGNYITSSGTSLPQISVLAQIGLFPQRRQIYILDAQVQYRDQHKDIDQGRIRVMKKKWFRDYQRHILETMVKVFYGEGWRICYGMYPRYIKSIMKHFRRKEQVGCVTVLDRLPWLRLVLAGKEYYKLHQCVRQNAYKLFNKYMYEHNVLWNQPTLVNII